MSGSTFGKLFRITTFGESHGVGLGVVIDGCPSGLNLSIDDITTYMNRRRPGSSAMTTPRKESDTFEILSGVFDGVTTGAPIAILVRNQNQKSKDYDVLADKFRPGHADRSWEQKFGFRDHRGGGRSSGRETIGRVLGGAIAKQLLATLHISVSAFPIGIGGLQVPDEAIDLTCCAKNPLGLPTKDPEPYLELVESVKACGDSLGGTIRCIATGLPEGLGEPVFDKLDARLGQALFSIGGVKGVEIGSGFACSYLCGSEHNDAFVYDGQNFSLATNHAGGVLGGISTCAPLLCHVHCKPTPSIGRPQKILDKKGDIHEMPIRGRHDPLIVTRASVVVEAMTSLVLIDLMLEHMGSQLISIKHHYGKKEL